MSLSNFPGAEEGFYFEPLLANLIKFMEAYKSIAEEEVQGF